jgi:hypothetical protein
MTEPVAGIDPHQKTFTIGIVNSVGVEIHVETFDNTGTGYAAAINTLSRNGVRCIGIEGSAS